MKNRKILPWFLLLLVAVPALAQTARWQYKSKSIAVNDADTVYFAFRSTSFFDALMADTAAINPPNEVYNDDLSVLSIRRTSGNAADSVIVYAKGLDETGRIVRNDSVFVFGAAYAAPASPNIWGNGGLHTASLAGLMAKYHGVMIVCKVFDLAGGTRRFEFGHGIP